MTDALLRQYADGRNLSDRASIYAFQAPRYDLVAELLATLPPSGAHPDGTTVLDVGCGRGQYLAGLVAAGYRATGLDLSPGMAAEARGASGAPTMRGDATHLPVPSGTFDAAIAPHMLYHLPDPIAGVRELRRIVAPGGTVTIITNDRRHMDTYRDLMAEAAGRDRWLPWPGESFTLEHRPAVEAVLGPCRMIDLSGTITLTSAEPLVRYAASGAEFYERAVAEPWTDVVAVIGELARERLARHGSITVATHSGLLVARPGR